MDIKIVTKEKFSVIGKTGQGLSDEAGQWIPRIWEEANADFNAIAPFIKKDESGNIEGIWGLMSDVDEAFARWGEYGKYLAGCEAENDALPPEGFTKWTVPAQSYVVAECNGTNYGEVFRTLVDDYIPNNHMVIIGAIHEHYPQPDNPDRVELYMPVAADSSLNRP